MTQENKKGQHRPVYTFLYNVLLALVSPILLLWLAYRLLVRGKSQEGIWERMGVFPADVQAICASGDPVVWFHAASVGEVAAAEPIIGEFALREPLVRIVVSTITPTGRRRAEQMRSRHEIGIMYFPFDVPFVVQRVFSQMNPVAFVMVETELWPNVLAEAHRRGVRVAMVNARLAGRSWSTGRFLKPLYAWMLGAVDIICAQSKVDAERFVALGAAPSRVEVAGNSKFDQSFPDAGEARAMKWRSDFGFGPEEPLLLAGSTHADEEDQILQLYQQLRVEFLDLQLIIAPRHPERADEIEALIRQHGYDVTRRTRVVAGGEAAPTGAQSAIARVGLLDTLGELASVYTAADVVFVGGSLARIGGHDILQPLAQGKAVVFGPHTHKSRDTTELALRDGVACQVRNAEELLVRVHELLTDERLRERLKLESPQWIRTYAGASVRCAENLAELLQNDAHVEDG